MKYAATCAEHKVDSWKRRHHPNVSNGEVLLFKMGTAQLSADAETFN